MRESAIDDLAGASTEKVQQTAGRIVMADEILVLAKCPELMDKWRRIDE
jgi:hypothetical protein